MDLSRSVRHRNRRLCGTTTDTRLCYGALYYSTFTPSMSIASAVARTRLLIRQFSSNSMATGKSPIDALSSFSTCELSDALIKLGVPHGGHIPDVQAMNDQSSQATLCGPAYTIKMVWSGASDEKLVLHDGKHWVDTVPEGSVVVINAPSS